MKKIITEEQIGGVLKTIQDENVKILTYIALQNFFKELPEVKESESKDKKDVKKA